MSKHKTVMWNTLNEETQDDIIRARKREECCVPWGEGGFTWAICRYHIGFDRGVTRAKERNE